MKESDWKDTKWYPVDGIGLFNGGGCYETYWHRRWFFKRIKLWREWKKIDKEVKNENARKKER